jgi:prevent-host-death family protein
MAKTSVKTVPLAETKDKLAEYVRVAEGGDDVVITRHGRPVVAIVAAGDLTLLRRLRAARSGRGLAGLAGGWAGSGEVARLALKRRRTSRRRRAKN